MRNQAPIPADRPRFRDATFLGAIAIVALALGALTFFLQKAERAPSVTATASDERSSVPLPAGPRKHQ
jgi:hypothetical protein